MGKVIFGQIRKSRKTKIRKHYVPYTEKRPGHGGCTFYLSVDDNASLYILCCFIFKFLKTQNEKLKS